MGDPVLPAELFQPVRSLASGSYYYMIRIDGLFFCSGSGFFNDNASADLLLHQDVPAVAAKQDIYSVIQKILFNLVIDFLGLLCTQMAYGAVYQF